MSNIDPILVPPMPKPADRSANKPTYLVSIEDPESKTKFAYYKALNVNKNATHVEIRGFEISKKQADELRKNPQATIDAGREINHEIPWQKIIRIENVTYKTQTKKETK